MASKDGVMPGITVRRARRPRLVAGRVLDSKGRAIAGVEVFQSGDGPKRTRSNTDDAGRFEVRGLVEGPAFLFARKDGFRFSGRRVDPLEKAVDLTLIRLDEPAAPLSLVPPPVDRAEERAIARSLVGAVWRKAVEDGDRQERAQVGPMMAAVDPDRVVELIESQVIAADEPILTALALAKLEDGPRQGVEALDEVGPAGVFVDLFDRRPDLPIEFRRSLLDRALARPEPSIELLARVAGRWLDLGEPGRARPLLDRAVALEANPPEGVGIIGFGNTPSDLAMTLARVDLPAAMKLIDKERSGQGLDHLRARLAVQVAATDPAEAKRLLGLLKDDSRDNYRARHHVCLRMAAVDLAAATSLASGFGDPLLDAVLPAMSARALAATDPKLARERFAQSFDRLEKLAHERGAASQQGQGPSPMILMARLLPVATRVDPEHAREAFWRVVAARPPRSITLEPRPIFPWHRQDYADLAELAAILGRYDRPAAEAVFAPVLDRVPGMDDQTWGLGNEVDDIFRAAAAFDPRSAVALLEALPDDPTPPSTGDRNLINNQFRHKAKADARLAVILALGQPPAIRMREINPGMNSLQWMTEWDD